MSWYFDAFCLQKFFCRKISHEIATKLITGQSTAVLSVRLWAGVCFAQTKLGSILAAILKASALHVGLPIEDAFDHWNEMLQGKGVILGIKGLRVIPLAKLNTSIKVWTVLELIAHFLNVFQFEAILVDIGLEDFMVLQNPVVLWADVRPQKACRNLPMVDGRPTLAEVVQQGTDHRLLITAIAKRQGSSLKPMSVAIHRESLVVCGSSRF